MLPAVSTASVRLGSWLTDVVNTGGVMISGSGRSCSPRSMHWVTVYGMVGAVIAHVIGDRTVSRVVWESLVCCRVRTSWVGEIAGGSGWIHAAVIEGSTCNGCHIVYNTDNLSPRSQDRFPPEVKHLFYFTA